MEFGLFTEFQCPAGMSEAAAFEEALAQVTAAEDLGYEAVWLAELHRQQGATSPSACLARCISSAPSAAR